MHLHHLDRTLGNRLSIDTIPWLVVSDCNRSQITLMAFLRRIATAVLAVVLVPILVLAALPVRYCIGTGGHQALEFVLEGVFHGGAHGSHDGNTEVALLADNCAKSDVVVQEDGCDDRALMDAVFSVALGEPEQLSLPALRAQVPPPTPPLQLKSASTTPREREFAARSDPRLSMHGTVVLRI